MGRCCEKGRKGPQGELIGFFCHGLLVNSTIKPCRRAGRGAALLAWPPLRLLGRVKPKLLDVAQEAEQSAHLFAAHGRGQVGHLDDGGPRYPAHFGKKEERVTLGADQTVESDFLDKSLRWAPSAVHPVGWAGRDAVRDTLVGPTLPLQRDY